MFSTIVHPTDLSEVSLPALHAAHRLAKDLRAKLLVCYIATPPLMASGDELTNPKTGETRDIASELNSHVAEEKSVTRELRLMVVDQSTGVKGLLGFLQGLDADLIVMGMHKRPGVVGWFGSSLTEEVVRLADCAVLVVKHDADDSEEADSEE